MGFKEARLKAGLTQKQAAEVFGVSIAAVSLWEIGDTMPSAKKLALIAKTYGCTIDKLISGE